MHLLLLSSWNTAEMWWQLVISIFNSWEVFFTAILPAGVVLTCCPHSSGRLTKTTSDVDICVCGWTKVLEVLSDYKRAMRSKWSCFHPGRCSAL